MIFRTYESVSVATKYQEPSETKKHNDREKRKHPNLAPAGVAVAQLNKVVNGEYLDPIKKKKYLDSINDHWLRKHIEVANLGNKIARISTPTLVKRQEQLLPKKLNI